MVHVKQNLTGQMFGFWKVLYQAEDYVSPQNIHYARWHCLCTGCDKNNEKDVTDRSLKSGESKSCGCHKIKVSMQNGKNNRKHNSSHSRLYNIWRGMKQRCYDKHRPEYYNYGGRGIKICAEWKDSFETFQQWALTNGYNETLTLERIDTNKDYNPNNCCWTTMKRQQRNRRNNLLITYNNVTKTLSEWAEDLGFSTSMLWRRINISGLSIEEALTIPKHKKGEHFQ